MPKKFTTYFKNNEIEKFSEQVEDVVYRAQVKFSDNIDDIADSNLNKFNDLLRKELNLAIKNTYFQNIELLKSSFTKQFLDFEVLSSLNKKGKMSLTQLLFNILQNISKNHINL
ncbi:hypothetical protein [Candidatus Mesenet endosymbiont of Agriotes lineatus]|uniref:hypothetical protein n=1 Tax=Candidatus Mesenet endosymbiont of Agriotes lineatus TaxID=3077948 RepID=UPI0030D036BC